VSDLFGWFQSYLNLSKLAALTVPGMVIAFGLILVLGPIPCRDDVKNCPYCTDSLKPVAGASATPEAETLKAHFSMMGPNGVREDDTGTLVLDWDKIKTTEAEKKDTTSDPTVVFTSTSDPDPSDVATYAWKVDANSICGGSATSPPPGNKKAQSSNSSDTSTSKQDSSGSQTPPKQDDKKRKKAPPESDTTAKPDDQGAAKDPCKQVVSYQFHQDAIKAGEQNELQDVVHKVTLTVTNKDGKLATVTGLVVVAGLGSKPALKPSFVSCPFPIENGKPLRNDATCGKSSDNPFPGKLTLPYGEKDPLLFEATDLGAKHTYLWKQDGRPICSGRKCLISFNSPNGKANPTGTWAVSLDVTDVNDPKAKVTSTAEQLLVRDPEPPIFAYPTSLSFLANKHGRVMDSPQTITLTIAPGLEIKSFVVSKSGPGRDLFSYSLTEHDTQRTPTSAQLEAGKQYDLKVSYSPDVWFSPHFLIDRFRAKRGTPVNAVLSIVALDHSTGIEKQVTLSIPLSASPNPDSAVASADASKKKKLANNTLITSSDTLLKSGADAKGDINRSAVNGNVNAILEANLPKDDLTVANFISSCKGVPVYVVSGSRPTASASGSSAGSSSESKQGSPQYAGETATSVQDILAVSDQCVVASAQLDQLLQSEIADSQAKITQYTTELNALTTALTGAQTAGNQLIVQDLEPKVAQKSAQVASEQSRFKSLTQADAYVTGLGNSTSTNEKGIISQVNTGPTASNSNAVTDVFSTIQQHFLMFLLFSLVIGQMFDPIQRGLLSFAGPRRNVFVALNKVYGTSQGDGEIRYGDRRLPPWTERESYLPDLREPGTVQEANSMKKRADQKGLRYSPADFLFRRNMNIYDQNYAIGAGYISQSEFNQIYNEFFRESQITTGLILPLLILSICIGIRYICCSSYSTVGPSSWWAVGSILSTIYFAVVVGILLLLMAAWMGSREYWKVVEEALRVGVLAQRYIQDPKGMELKKRWAALDDRRQKLEHEQDSIEQEKARLNATEQKFAEERSKRRAEAQGIEIGQQIRAAYLRALQEFPRSFPSSEYSKWLFEEGAKLFGEGQQYVSERDLEKDKAFDREIDAHRDAFKANTTRLNAYRETLKSWSEERRKLIGDMKEYEASLQNTGKLGDWAALAWQDPFVKVCVLLLIPGSLVVFANLQVLDWGTLPVIGMPCLFLAPLWVAGLDRLHKYYSELQARISGNILRQQQTTMQKMVDMVTSSSSKSDLMKNLSSALTEQSSLLSFLGNTSGSTASGSGGASDSTSQSPGIPPLTLPAEGSDEPKGDG
jgi:hypothetical protein